MRCQVLVHLKGRVGVGEKKWSWAVESESEELAAIGWRHCGIAWKWSALGYREVCPVELEIYREIAMGVCDIFVYIDLS